MRSTHMAKWQTKKNTDSERMWHRLHACTKHVRRVGDKERSNCSSTKHSTWQRSSDTTDEVIQLDIKFEMCGTITVHVSSTSYVQNKKRKMLLLVCEASVACDPDRETSHPLAAASLGERRDLHGSCRETSKDVSPETGIALGFVVVRSTCVCSETLLDQLNAAP